MLNNVIKTTTITANSQIDGENVLFLSASIRTNSEVNINKAVLNFDLYTENVDACRQDFADFETQVNDLAKEILKSAEE